MEKKCIKKRVQWKPCEPFTFLWKCWNTTTPTTFRLRNIPFFCYRCIFNLKLYQFVPGEWQKLKITSQVIPKQFRIYRATEQCNISKQVQIQWAAHFTHSVSHTVKSVKVVKNAPIFDPMVPLFLDPGSTIWLFFLQLLGALSCTKLPSYHISDISL